MQRPFRASSLYDTSKNNPFNQKVFARYLTQIQPLFNLTHPSQAVKGCCTICWNRATAGVPNPPFGGAGAWRIVFRASPNMNRRRRSPRLWRGAKAPGIYLRAFLRGFGISRLPKGIAMPVFPMTSCVGTCVRVVRAESHSAVWLCLCRDAGDSAWRGRSMLLCQDRLFCLAP